MTTDNNLPDDPFPDADANDPFVQVFRELYAKSTPERRKFLLDMVTRADFAGERQRTWIFQFTKLAKNINDEGRKASALTVELFWIRLYGVLAEIPVLYRGLANMRGDAPNNPFVQAAGVIYDAVAEMRSLLSDDEIVLIDWLRTLAAHVRQRGFEVRWDKKAEVTDDSKKIDLLNGTHFTSKEILERTNRVLAAHGDGAEFAVALVTRLEKAILRLYVGAKATAPKVTPAATPGKAG